MLRLASTGKAAREATDGHLRKRGTWTLSRSLTRTRGLEHHTPTGTMGADVPLAPQQPRSSAGSGVPVLRDGCRLCRVRVLIAQSRDKWV